MSVQAAPERCDVIGGGEGYTEALLLENVPSYVTATNFDELKQYVESGQSYIYIPGTITITVPNVSSSLRVKSGQTIFSDRGVRGSQGAILITPYLNNNENTYPVYAAGRLCPKRVPSG